MSEKTVSGDENLTLFWFAFETESVFFRRVYERKKENEFQKQIKTKSILSPDTVFSRILVTMS